MIREAPLPGQSPSFISRGQWTRDRQKSGSSNGALLGSVFSLPLMGLQRKELGEELVPTLGFQVGFSP